MKKNKEIQLRSSCAEYLTFIANCGADSSSMEMRYENENIWLSQKMIACLYDVPEETIAKYIQAIYADKELEENATTKKYLVVLNEENNKTNANIHYNLEMIIALGFKINNEKAIQFRKWVNKIVKDYTIQGWVMDEERLKNGGSILTQDYFEKQLEKIREIRLSERRFYQKITDIYATSIDYDPKALATQRFFQAVQNKLHYAVHGQTAAEIIYTRADAKKENMGLTTWEGAPQSKIHQYDVIIAKNYLNDFELKQMGRIVSAYLDMAEVQATRHIPMTMADWETRLNGFLGMWDHEVLQDAGKVSAELAKQHALTEFEKYRVIQDKLYQSDFDQFLKLEVQLKK